MKRSTGLSILDRNDDHFGKRRTQGAQSSTAMLTNEPAIDRAFRPTVLAAIMRRRDRLASCVLVGAALSLGSAEASAQVINSYFPPGTFGFDRALGVTVLSRERSLYDTSGIPAGAFIIRPQVDESLFFNSNPNGSSTPSGSAGVRTGAAIAAASNWNRNSFEAVAGVDDHRYFSQPRNNFTDWNVGLRGGYTISDSELAVGYAHKEYYQLGTVIGAVASQTPMLTVTDTAQINYTVNLNRFAFTPDLSASAYRFGTATVAGVKLSQAFLDRNVVAAGLTTRYSMSDVGGILFIVRASSDHYLHGQAGQLSNNSTSLDLLTGFDYQAKGPWRYRFLVGVEQQSYQASQLSSQTATLVEGSIIWTPSGRTTLTGSVLRSIEPPQTSGTRGYVLTSPKLTIDFELLRNVILQGRAAVQYAEFLQGGGTQTSYAAGASANWLITPLLRMSFDADYVKQVGTTNANIPTSGKFDQTVVAVTLHFAI
jgi:hypothetical protein